jgi:hypothetical protein
MNTVSLGVNDQYSNESFAVPLNEFYPSALFAIGNENLPIVNETLGSFDTFNGPQAYIDTGYTDHDTFGSRSSLPSSSLVNNLAHDYYQHSPSFPVPNVRQQDQPQKYVDQPNVTVLNGAQSDFDLDKHFE